jgi:hypothetical protein
MSVVMEMHQEHVARRARLMQGRAPEPKPTVPRPISPFVKETRARREAAVKAEREFREMMQRARKERQNSGPHWSRIVEQVCKKHGLVPNDILRPSRAKRTVAARNEAFYRMRTEILIGGLPMSFPSIGKRFGGMDHTTVLHGYRRHSAFIGLEANPRPARLYQNPGMLAGVVDGGTRTHSIEDHLLNGRVV